MGTDPPIPPPSHRPSYCLATLSSPHPLRNVPDLSGLALLPPSGPGLLGPQNKQFTLLQFSRPTTAGQEGKLAQLQPQLQLPVLSGKLTKQEEGKVVGIDQLCQLFFVKLENSPGNHNYAITLGGTFLKSMGSQRRE